MKYIATNIKSNIRELEGALRKVIASSRLNNTELSLSLAEDALKDIIYPEAPKEIKIFKTEKSSHPERTWHGCWISRQLC